MKKVLLFVMSLLLCMATFSQTILWQKLYGGSAYEYANSMQQTSDGGSIIAGYSSSSASGDVKGTSNGNYDMWIVKLNASGDTLWEKLYGGLGDDEANSIQQTADGGYIVAGYSNSSKSGDVTGATNGNYDYWILKLDASGNIVWQKLYGGSLQDYAYSVQQTADGGFLVAGFSNSPVSGSITGTSNGGNDYWILKLDASGNINWQKLYGGSGDDYARSVQQTSDGGYIIGGYSNSSTSGNVTGTSNGSYDDWIIKLDGSGNIIWQKLYGGSNGDFVFSIQQTSDGGYIVGSVSSSSGSGNVTGTNNGDYDYWILKLDASGNITWQKLYGGSDYDYINFIQQTSDGGYIVAGYSASSASGDVTDINKGGYDAWVIRLDASGTIKWQKLYGGSGNDQGFSVYETSNGNYIVAALSGSSQNGDVTGAGNGGYDFWILSLSNQIITPVILKSFTGSLSNNYVSLQWQSGVESNFNHYMIEQSTDGKAFTYIANITAKGSNQSYGYKLMQAASIAYYRLAIVDNDGSISYSPVIVLSQKNNAASISVYPNPAQDYITITATETGVLKIYNAKGSLVKKQTISAGRNKINIGNLSSGIYCGLLNRDKFSFIKE